MVPALVGGDALAESLPARFSVSRARIWHGGGILFPRVMGNVGVAPRATSPALDSGRDRAGVVGRRESSACAAGCWTRGSVPGRRVEPAAQLRACGHRIEEGHQEGDTESLSIARAGIRRIRAGIRWRRWTDYLVAAEQLVRSTVLCRGGVFASRNREHRTGFASARA